MVAGTHSGAGKTTVATGLMAALRRRGRNVASAKVGPDFIDPGYHTLATGRPGRNLDVWMSGAAAVAPLAARAGAGADLLVVEGVMGLFDGAADGTPSSTAEVAKLIGAPVVLVVDAASMSQSVAALIHGYRSWDPQLRVAGVILNRVGSDSHEAMLRAALAGPPGGPPVADVLGVLHRDDSLSWRSRHLGLLPIAEDPAGVRGSIDRLAALIDAGCDLEAIEASARSAPTATVGRLPAPAAVGRARIAVASGPAFSFTYLDNVEALEAAGAEVVPFDPCVDAGLPESIQAVVAGGGFPEVFAEALSANRPMLSAIAAHARRGGVTWAECGGLLWLARSLDGWPMAGVVDAAAHMTERRVLGYRSGETTTASPFGRPGIEVRGHEFHYTETDPPGDALRLTGRHGTSLGGFASPRLLASYLHMHLGASPGLAEAFVRAAAAVDPAARGALAVTAPTGVS
ncbi:cobyrinate a,c-diamide synthase [Acidiferrimicrobium sp. IK]|uniref:cobyrinate a,c-diamide synthase n=1 Tax=Acidiferrimicrobium sp. IK TaxID=2871700 RepID=UPI0021CB62AE|nr:cobyrinate a,c-diamide synthase [Acidiferrimicrobium sp. IK]MCU4187448.1 cobyrinate a,c-diamide synthase [Acidiferrimicrobium sp. IK]